MLFSTADFGTLNLKEHKAAALTIQGVSKMLGQTSGVSSPHENKGKSSY
jgi:hypothetical protein